jgi:hypothetical protein
MCREACRCSLSSGCHAVHVLAIVILHDRAVALCVVPAACVWFPQDCGLHGNAATVGALANRRERMRRCVCSCSAVVQLQQCSLGPPLHASCVEFLLCTPTAFRRSRPIVAGCLQAVLCVQHKQQRMQQLEAYRPVCSVSARWVLQSKVQGYCACTGCRQKQSHSHQECYCAKVVLLLYFNQQCRATTPVPAAGRTRAAVVSMLYCCCTSVQQSSHRVAAVLALCSLHACAWVYMDNSLERLALCSE